MLKQANPEDRAALYAEFGLTLRYDPTKHQVKATAEFSRVGRGVGGPTSPVSDWRLGASSSLAGKGTAAALMSGAGRIREAPVPPTRGAAS